MLPLKKNADAGSAWLIKTQMTCFLLGGWLHFKSMWSN